MRELFKNIFDQTKKVNSTYREKYEKNSKKVTILNTRIICQDKFLCERKNIEKVIDGFDDAYFAKEVNREKNRLLIFYSSDCFIQCASNMIKKFIGKDHTKCFLANLEQNDISLASQIWK